MMTVIGFYLLMALAVIAGVVLVTSRNLLHAVLALGVASLAIAGVMLTLGAEFLAFVLVLVYVGAVVVLGVFAVMLTGHFDRPTLPPSNELKTVAGLVSLALTALLCGVALVQPPAAAAATPPLTVQALGALLLTDFVLPFELVSVLLLAALLGALVIARRQETNPQEAGQ
jgi:NADH-quinone oxidoreductase subunit J